MLLSKAKIWITKFYRSTGATRTNAAQKVAETVKLVSCLRPLKKKLKSAAWDFFCFHKNDYLKDCAELGENVNIEANL